MRLHEITRCPSCPSAPPSLATYFLFPQAAKNLRPRRSARQSPPGALTLKTNGGDQRPSRAQHRAQGRYSAIFRPWVDPLGPVRPRSGSPDENRPRLGDGDWSQILPDSPQVV